MPRRNGRVPSCRLHRPTGQARVIVDGKFIYLGKFGSLESRAKYSRILAELAARTDRPNCFRISDSDSLFFLGN